LLHSATGVFQNENHPLDVSSGEHLTNPATLAGSELMEVCDSTTASGSKISGMSFMEDLYLQMLTIYSCGNHSQKLGTKLKKKLEKGLFFFFKHFWTL
jgi:hypothetical protein